MEEKNSSKGTFNKHDQALYVPVVSTAVLDMIPITNIEWEIV